MTNQKLNVLEDAIGSYIEQVDDLSDRFNGSDGSIQEFAREYDNNLRTTDIVLTAMKLRGLLQSYKFEVTHQITKPNDG